MPKKRGNKWYTDFYFNGTRIRKVSPVNTRKGANEYQNFIKTELLKGNDMQPKKKVWIFEEYAEYWFKTYAKANNKHSTLRAKRATLDTHLIPFFGGKSLDEIQTRSIEQYKCQKLEEGSSKKSINNQLSVLSTMLRLAQEWEYIQNMPRIRRLKAPMPSFQFLSEADCSKLINASATKSHKLQAMVMCALHTGMRRGELVALKWENVDLDLNQICVKQSFVDGKLSTPKNNRTRYVAISNEFREMLIGLKGQGSDYVFSPNGSTPLTCARMREALYGVCKVAGINKIGWHVLRHTFASHLAMQGVPLRMIQVLMGHSTIQMTERYSHLSPSSLSNAVEALNGLKNGKLKTFGHIVVTNKIDDSARQIA